MIIFDINGFLYTDDSRELSLSLDGNLITVCMKKLSGTDLWIVPSGVLENALQKRFLVFYPMFFGVLLTTLHEKRSSIPIYGVSLDDVNTAYETNKLQELADSIALGVYKHGIML